MRSILYILKNNADLVQMLGGKAKIRTNVASQSQKPPYVVLDLEDSQSFNSYDSSANVDYLRVTISCVSDRPYSDQNNVGADDVERMVRKAIDHIAKGVYGGEELLFCHHQETSMQEDRIANSIRIYKDAEYLVGVRPLSVEARVSVTSDLVNVTSLPLLDFINLQKLGVTVKTFPVTVS